MLACPALSSCILASLENIVDMFSGHCELAYMYVSAGHESHRLILGLPLTESKCVRVIFQNVLLPSYLADWALSNVTAIYENE